MITIVKQPTKRYCECPDCECGFMFEKTDARPFQSDYNETSFEVTCPACGRIIVLKSTEVPR